MYYADRVKMTTATTGTGTITLGSASSGYRTFASGGVPNSASVAYLIEDGSAWEVGQGVYTSTGTTLSRVLIASSTGSLLSLTGLATVAVIARSGDLNGNDHPGYVAGRWYKPLPHAAYASGNTFSTTATKFVPWAVRERVTISDLGARVTTAAGGGTVRLGIYASNSITKDPTGTVLGECTVSTTSTGAVSGALAANLTLEPGLYWQAGQSDSNTAVIQAVTSSVAHTAAMIGNATLATVTNTSTLGFVHYTAPIAFTSGLTDVTSETFTAQTSSAFIAFFKVASVP